MSIPLHQLLKSAVDNGASDLHITTESPPMLRIDSNLVPLKYPPLTPQQTQDICYSIMTDLQKHRFEENLELDFSFSVENIGRFRGNIYMQKSTVSGAFRVLMSEIRNIEQLGLPPVVAELARKPRGLLLVTGPTGSGKTTTMAAMIDQINEERHKHIVTVEDPLEYVFKHKNCIVNQREVGRDTKSFHNALRSVLREDPDIVLIGEMRDFETIKIALTLAETGHLTITTLHTNTAIQTINRIIDVFPPHEQPQVRSQLSFTLEGILCQSLLPKIGGGLALALEVLIPNAAVRNLIREDKIHQIYSQQQMGQEKHQMQTLNQSLAYLYMSKQITYKDAKSNSPDPDELEEIISQPDSGQRQRKIKNM